MCSSSTTTAQSSLSLPSAASRLSATHAFSIVVTATASWPGPGGRASGVPSHSPAKPRTASGPRLLAPSRLRYIGASRRFRSPTFSLTSDWNGSTTSARPAAPRAARRASARTSSTFATSDLPPLVGAQYTRFEPSLPSSMAALCQGYTAPERTPPATKRSTTAGGRPRCSRRRLAGPRISLGSSSRPTEEGCPRAYAGPPASPPGAGGAGGRSASGPKRLVGSSIDVPGSSSGLRLAPGRPAARRAATGVSMGTFASASSKAASSSGSNVGAHVENVFSTLLSGARPE